MHEKPSKVIPICELEPAKCGGHIMAVWLCVNRRRPGIYYKDSEGQFWQGPRDTWLAIVNKDRQIVVSLSDLEAVKSLWHKAVDSWLRNSSNDCLRARGDVRWQMACTAEMRLR